MENELLTKKELIDLLSHVEGQSRSWQKKIRSALDSALNILPKDLYEAYAAIESKLGSAAAASAFIKKKLDKENLKEE